jgi:hypothetical protein
MTVLVCYNRIYAWPQKIPVDQGGHLEFQNGAPTTLVFATA